MLVAPKETAVDAFKRFLISLSGMVTFFKEEKLRPNKVTDGCSYRPFILLM
jgi:hypothetical protein